MLSAVDSQYGNRPCPPAAGQAAGLSSIHCRFAAWVYSQLLDPNLLPEEGSDLLPEEDSDVLPEEGSDVLPEAEGGSGSVSQGEERPTELRCL